GLERRDARDQLVHAQARELDHAGLLAVAACRGLEQPLRGRVAPGAVGPQRGLMDQPPREEAREGGRGGPQDPRCGDGFESEVWSGHERDGEGCTIGATVGDWSASLTTVIAALPPRGSSEFSAAVRPLVQVETPGARAARPGRPSAPAPRRTADRRAP